MLLVWIFLFYLGFKAERITRQPFIMIVICVALFTLAYNQVAISNAERLGEDQTIRNHPAVYLIDVALTSTLWTLTYLAGFGVGRWRRSRKK